MSRQAQKQFDVNGSTYRVDQMNPMEGFRFGLKCAAALSGLLPALAGAATGKGGAAQVLAVLGTASIDEARLAELSDIAWQYLVLPNSAFGKNTLELQKWFQEHPADMFPVAALTVWKLVEDFFPSALRISKPAESSDSPPA